MYAYKTSQRLARILAEHEKGNTSHTYPSECSENVNQCLPEECEHTGAANDSSVNRNSASHTEPHSDESNLAPESSNPIVNRTPAPHPSTRPTFRREASPDFDARAASETLKSHVGYVSFADVDGLGYPHSDNDTQSLNGHSTPSGGWWTKLTPPFLHPSP